MKKCILILIVLIAAGNLLEGSVSFGRKEVFRISQEEERIFFLRLAKFYPAARMGEARKQLAELKKKYPEGYFILIKIGAREPQGFHAYYDENDPQSLNTAVHEFVHAANNECLYENNRAGVCQKEKWEVYLIGNQLVRFPYNASLEDQFLNESESIFAKIKSPTDFDRTYFSKDTGGPSYSILDEINAYTKSVRYAKALGSAQDILDDYANLLRQLYHLNIALGYAYTAKTMKKSLDGDRAFVAMALKLRDIALGEKVNVKDLIKAKGLDRTVIAEIARTRKLLQETDHIYTRLSTADSGRPFVELGNLGIQVKPVSALGLPGAIPVYADGQNPYDNSEEAAGYDPGGIVPELSNKEQVCLAQCEEKCPVSAKCDSCLENTRGDLDACSSCVGLIQCLDTCEARCL